MSKDGQQLLFLALLALALGGGAILAPGLPPKEAKK
jgi:hypothetical protein